jgi:signal transduction histidine kinase
MPLSRFRLRLAGWFALAFLAGLLLLSLTLFLYSHRASDRRFTGELATMAGQLAGAIRLEYADAPDKGLAAAASAALEEWPVRPEAFGVYQAEGRRLGVTGPPALVRWLPDSLGSVAGGARDLPGTRPRVRLVPVRSGNPPLTVVAASTTERLDAETRAFALWLLVSVPITVLLSFVGGYVLARQALHPVSRLEQAIGEIAPDALDRRLPVSGRPDELDRLAARFNTLLERLQQSQAQNQAFLQQAAHQIRTPLTLVLGETDLALEHTRTPAARVEALRRIRLAATQMRRRVEELLLLARASAGERAPLTDMVELDGLILECADLMRGRAQALGARLELGRMEPIVVRASEPLLREALIELLENACRHGGHDSPVSISVSSRGPAARVEVANGMAGGIQPEPAADDRGLGLQVVRWIAAEHGGRLVRQVEGGRLLSILELPVAETGLSPSPGGDEAGLVDSPGTVGG